MTSHDISRSGPAEIIRRTWPTALSSRAGRDDVAGFAVVGQPFASGDVLCLRRFPASTFGPGYASVWHRSPTGQWTVYTSVAAAESCPRFIAAAAVRVVAETPISVEWTSAADLEVRVPAAELTWTMRVGNIVVTRMMNLMMGMMPAPMFHSDLVLGMMSMMSTIMLSAGRFRLAGHVPNRQWFQAGPRHVWVIREARASIAGRDLGKPAPLARQAMLGEVPMPQRGVLMQDAFSFEAYQPGRHLPPVAASAWRRVIPPPVRASPASSQMRHPLSRRVRPAAN